MNRTMKFLKIIGMRKKTTKVDYIKAFLAVSFAVITSVALRICFGESRLTLALTIVIFSVETAWIVTCFARELTFAETLSNLLRWSLAILSVMTLPAAYDIAFGLGEGWLKIVIIMLLAGVAARLLKWCLERKKKITETKLQEEVKRENFRTEITRSTLCALPPEDDINYKAGMDFLKGTHGCERSLPKALHCFEISAQLGSAYGSYQLARMYERGEGIAKPDCERAIYWMEKACALGHPQAEKRLKLLRAFWDE